MVCIVILYVVYNGYMKDLYSDMTLLKDKNVCNI